MARTHALISKPPGWKSGLSIRLIGADVEAIPTDRAPNRVPAYISVVGTWRDESIEVDEQSPDVPAREPSADWTDPPCPPPPGGWRHDALVFDLDGLRRPGIIRGDRHPGDLPSLRRPGSLVVDAIDADAVTQQVSPQLPNQLCVVPSRFTSAQLDEVRDVLLTHWREWRLETCGTGSAEPLAQPFATGEPFRVTADMAEWADTLPAGLLRLNPALRPA